MFPNPQRVAHRAGGHARARRLVTAVLVVVASMAMPGPSAAQSAPSVKVTERGGVYTVAAAFEVPESASIALATLTDYPRIPRFMPEVRVSRVLGRSEGHAIVEQEAVAQFMMFSKRVHLVLDIQEEGDAVRFSDRCGKSFGRYEGVWNVIATRDGATQITYALSAAPSFDVPEFLLKRLMKRDAAQMIERLKVEVSARSRQTTN